ncbi:hypothetical protein HS088_TW18G00913 [Tripterygium wilfordii]|uniref:Uncharacterized protein n=1 Tax=Tripterygium wilfordii TaxID=458696 RepID=A0A7J7CDP6_TRIWF|nr:hypothetical protein HS088_TW18G00913 [Tripterygium wilfordii]
MLMAVGLLGLPGLSIILDCHSSTGYIGILEAAEGTGLINGIIIRKFSSTVRTMLVVGDSAPGNPFRSTINLRYVTLLTIVVVLKWAGSDIESLKGSFEGFWTPNGLYPPAASRIP